MCMNAIVTEALEITGVFEVNLIKNNTKVFASLSEKLADSGVSISSGIKVSVKMGKNTNLPRVHHIIISRMPGLNMKCGDQSSKIPAILSG